MYRSLVVPLDGSSFGEQALPLALTVARKAGATLQVVHVHQPVAPVYSGSELGADLALDTGLRKQERDYLEGVVRRLAHVAPVPVSAALLEGPVAEEVREQAVSAGADLVVLTTHGRGPVSRLWLGSVADQLVRLLPMPVLVVRTRPEAPDLAAQPAPPHVLVPLDGSELAEQILGPATELGRLFGADFTLLRVIEPILMPYVTLTGNPLPALDPTLLAQLREEAERYLEGVADRLRAQGLRVQTRVVLNRPAAPAVLEQAQALDGGLIALATHGRGGLTRLFLGSVADKVLRGTTTPALVYRPLTQEK